MNLYGAEIHEERCPILFHIWKAMRQVAISKYGTLSPAMSKQSWGFTKRQKQEICDIQKKLGLKYTRYHHVGAREITEYMNTHLDQGSTFTEFAEYSPRCRHLVSPAWFITSQTSSL
jgi:hypothetical protein